jgi:galactokinase
MESVVSNTDKDHKEGKIEGDIEIFVPGRLCILGEHSDWAAEYRTVNPTISYGTAINIAVVDLLSLLIFLLQ